MLAARDQENLIHSHQQAASSKPLNQNIRAVPPKTPGNKYPKTPLKINLNDENEPAGFAGGRSTIFTKGKGVQTLVGGKNGTTLDKNAFITPLGPRNRAPLGAKTTNAKAKALQTPAGPNVDKDIQKTQMRPTSARRPKQRISHADTIKLDIHGDDNGPLEEREVEYCPPKPRDLPYESDVFPDGCLDYSILTGPKMTHIWQNYYSNPVDENGVSLKEKKFEEECAKAHKAAEERILKAIEEEEWTIGDVPEISKTSRTMDNNNVKGKNDTQTKKGLVLPSKGPATVASRKAASALSVVPKAPIFQKTLKSQAIPKNAVPFLGRGKQATAPAPANPSTMRHIAAAAASRSTIGYTKGRNASNALKVRTGGLPRSISNLSKASDTTITPATYAQKQGSDYGNQDWRKLMFSGDFDGDEEDLDLGLGSGLPECLRAGDESEEEFVLTLSGV